MPLDKQVSIHGITDIGEWTATNNGEDTNQYHADNVYTETSWGLTSEEGARITESVSTVKQRSGQSAGVVDSFISEYDAQLQIMLLDGQLNTLRRLMGLPTAALTGDLGGTSPTPEVLVVRGSEIGSEERQIYVRCMGPLGPRTYYFPRAKLATPPEKVHGKTAHFEPSATFDLAENDADPRELYWIIDAVV